MAYGPATAAPPVGMRPGMLNMPRLWQQEFGLPTVGALTGLDPSKARQPAGQEYLGDTIEGGPGARMHGGGSNLARRPPFGQQQFTFPPGGGGGGGGGIPPTMMMGLSGGGVGPSAARSVGPGAVSGPIHPMRIPPPPAVPGPLDPRLSKIPGNLADTIGLYGAVQNNFNKKFNDLPTEDAWRMVDNDFVRKTDHKGFPYSPTNISSHDQAALGVSLPRFAGSNMTPEEAWTKFTNGEIPGVGDIRSAFPFADDPNWAASLLQRSGFGGLNYNFGVPDIPGFGGPPPGLPLPFMLGINDPAPGGFGPVDPPAPPPIDPAPVSPPPGIDPGPLAPPPPPPGPVINPGGPPPPGVDPFADPFGGAPLGPPIDPNTMFGAQPTPDPFSGPPVIPPIDSSVFGGGSQFGGIYNPGGGGPGFVQPFNDPLAGSLGITPGWGIGIGAPYDPLMPIGGGFGGGFGSFGGVGASPY